MAERGEWGGKPNKGGRAGSRRQAEEEAALRRSRRGEEGWRGNRFQAGHWFLIHRRSLRK